MIGISQAIAILPGISRSGATISTLVLLGVDKEKSARFSFLMVVPLILGKMGKDIVDCGAQIKCMEKVTTLIKKEESIELQRLKEVFYRFRTCLLVSQTLI